MRTGTTTRPILQQLGFDEVIEGHADGLRSPIRQELIASGAAAAPASMAGAPHNPRRMSFDAHEHRGQSDCLIWTSRKPARLNITYEPDGGATSPENPAAVHLAAGDRGPGALCPEGFPRSRPFPDGGTLVFRRHSPDFLTPDVPFDPGRHYWSYRGLGTCNRTPRRRPGARREPSRSAKVCRRSRCRRGRLATRPPRWRHPRLWLGPKQLSAFRAKVAEDADYLRLVELLREVRAAMARPRDHGRARALSRTTRASRRCGDRPTSTARKLIYAIRHLAIAGHVLNDAALLERAKAWLLAASDWEPDGTTSRAYNDEWAFRVTVALAWGYDWLHDELSPDERDRRPRRAAGADPPGGGPCHPPRQHPSVSLRQPRRAFGLGGAGAGLHRHAGRGGRGARVARLLRSSSCSPSIRPGATADGGWAEGPHYWMTGMAYLTEAANLLKNFTGLDLYSRPFFQKTGDFPLYTKAPDTRRGPSATTAPWAIRPASRSATMSASTQASPAMPTTSGTSTR